MEEQEQEGGRVEVARCGTARSCNTLHQQSVRAARAGNPLVDLRRFGFVWSTLRQRGPQKSFVTLRSPLRMNGAAWESLGGGPRSLLAYLVGGVRGSRCNTRLPLELEGMDRRSFPSLPSSLGVRIAYAVLGARASSRLFFVRFALPAPPDLDARPRGGVGGGPGRSEEVRRVDRSM